MLLKSINRHLEVRPRLLGFSFHRNALVYSWPATKKLITACCRNQLNWTKNTIWLDAYACADLRIKTANKTIPASVNKIAGIKLAAVNITKAIVANKPPIDKPMPHFWTAVKLWKEVRKPSASNNEPAKATSPKIMWPKINQLNICVSPLSFADKCQLQKPVCHLKVWRLNYTWDYHPCQLNLSIIITR